MDLLLALALLSLGLLAGGLLGYGWGRRSHPPTPAPAFLTYPAPERRWGLDPPAPFLLIRADPGAPVEYHR